MACLLTFSGRGSGGRGVFGVVFVEQHAAARSHISSGVVIIVKRDAAGDQSRAANGQSRAVASESTCDSDRVPSEEEATWAEASTVSCEEETTRAIAKWRGQ
jgi:hypothetical protein